MLRIQFLLLLLLPFLAFGQEKGIIIQEQLPKVPPKNLDLYLVIGQSNMAGRATIRETEKGPLERVFLLTESTTEPWVVATNPLNRHSTIRKNRGMQRLSPAYAFAKTMTAANSNKEIGLIANAKGGTKIVQWLPTTHFFKEAVQRTKAAMKYGTLKGIIWHQGESDCDSLRASLYLGRLEILINGFRYVSHLEGTNLWEFGCGAGADAHAGGWKQDNVQPEHQFLRVKGGYLVGKVSSKGGSTSIKFQHRDVDGNIVNEVIFPKKG